MYSSFIKYPISDLNDNYLNINKFYWPNIVYSKLLKWHSEHFVVISLAQEDG